MIRSSQVAAAAAAIKEPAEDPLQIQARMFLEHCRLVCSFCFVGLALLRSPGLGFE